MNICKGLKHDSIVKCIKGHTYGQPPTLVKEIKGYLNVEPLPAFKWIPDFSLSFVITTAAHRLTQAEWEEET